VSILNAQGLILSLAAAFFLTAFTLYHLMIFRVNRLLSPGEKLPHSLDFTKGNRLARQYRALYPRSNLYHLTIISAASMFALAVAFVCLRLLS